MRSLKKLLAQADVMEAGWSLGGHNENEGKVAAEFTSRFPSCELVKFCNTGTSHSLDPAGPVLG